MKATDLRQNNLILYNDKIVTVSGTVGNTIYYKGDAEVYFDSNIGETYQPFKPIPLTEEWLLKFGFDKRVQGVCDDFHIGHNEVTHDWLFDLVWLKNSVTDEYEKFPFYRNGRHGIKYIHQLQNLYFALTGGELIIK